MFLWVIIFVVCVDSSWCLPTNIETLFHRRALTKISHKECSIGTSERKDCGYYGIKENGCSSRACCWRESIVPGVPWCYHSIPASSAICVSSEANRRPCSRQVARMDQCLALGCCWRPQGKSRRGSCIEKVIPAEINPENCGHPVVPPMTLGRIIGGVDARANSWPWMASLQRNGSHFCGGSLINDRWILSAAHCADTAVSFGEYFTIVVGAQNISISAEEKTKQTYSAVLILPHAEYNSSDDEDRAVDYMLIKLERSVEYTSAISPICLANTTPPPGTRCYSTGWGLWSWADYSVPDILQQFMAPILSNEYCNEPDVYNGTISELNLCGGYEEGGRSNCFGDSGGPLVCRHGDRWQQVGLVSFGGIPCGSAMKPPVYANTCKGLEWIKSTLAAN